MEELLVFGHSVTNGFWDPEGGWVQRLRKILDRKALKSGKEEDVYYLYNLSIAGDTAKDLNQRIRKESDRRKEEDAETLIIIQIGANDAMYYRNEDRVETSLEEFKNQFKELIAKAEALAEKTVVVGGFPMDPGMEVIPYQPNIGINNKRLEKYEEAKRKICKDTDTHYIDLYPLMKDRDNSDYLEEGVHPNKKGHEMITEKVEKEIKDKGLLSL
ncbi:MAG: SGNH/GDSL hydrolase family protein [Candidatus Nanohalobium sp.]